MIHDQYTERGTAVQAETFGVGTGELRAAFVDRVGQARTSVAAEEIHRFPERHDTP
ncbi:hypothetical protein [Lentzea sp.]|uniref:hypothetical protein n=1 Tax=Lentzea sp. TaxID=56099 RepID=UPI002CE306FE|nr:hypothetical protein [Lentzea sp.]HUQ60778.1 hypothetical protein [Lentzea sp.]